MPKRHQYTIPALKTAVIYAIFGGLWISLSDHILELLVTDLQTFSTIQTYKGWAYILLTAGLVFHLSTHHLKRALALQEETELGRERYELALEGAHVGLWDWDIATGDVVFSKEYTKMLGYNQKDFPPIYQSWEALVHPEDKPRVLETVQDHLEGKTDAFSMEFRMLTAQKKWKWIHARGKAFRFDSAGNPTRAIGVHIDLTQRLEAEKALEVAKEAAEAGSLAKSRFLANLSHEVRTPLNGILGMLRLLQSQQLTTEQLEFVSAAEASAHNLLNVVNDLTSISRLEENQMDVCEETVDVHILRETLNRVFSIQLKENRVTLDFIIDPGMPDQLCGDQGKLRQILFNLVGNALRSSQDDTVTVEALAIEDRRNPDIALLLFTITDNGPGLPEDELHRMFESFDQASGMELLFGGMGVGLRMASRLVALLGGTLCVESEQGKGTLVNFTIRAHFTAPPEQLDTITDKRDKKHILVVEDEPINRKLLTHFLQKLGHSVVTANDGSEVVPRLRQEDFDCIFMDIRMPGMDGVEATQAVRESSDLGSGADVPIIALTAHAVPEERQHYQDLGMNGFLIKPVSVEDLERELSRIFSSTES